VHHGNSSNVKKMALILLFLPFTGCSFQAKGSNAVAIRAVYFVHGQSELSSEELQMYPEIAVVQTFDELKMYQCMLYQI